MSGAWRDDLAANCQRHGWRGALAGWLTSPGFRAVTRYRVARWMYLQGGLIRSIAILVEQGNARIGCYLSSKAAIGPGLRMPHPVAVVVGEGCVVGRNVALYQSVTLGRRHADRADYPVIGDDVTLYVGATVIGGVTIGQGAVVGAHRLVTADLPAGERLPAIGSGATAHDVAKVEPTHGEQAKRRDQR